MAVTLTESVPYKRLVTAGNDELWYEDLDVAAGTMTELTAANGDIDTSDQLNMFEAYQKVFIVNGSNLKVADFVNYKLTHTALDTQHAKGDVLTQATTNATMVVDFTNTAKTATYGYVTSGTFNATNQVTGNGSGSAFTPSAVTASPHWYDWTVYPGGSSGTMPTKAYLGCLYRGRCVTSGNPNYPHQWYMSKVADPWNFLYDNSSPLSAVSGNDTYAGEVGDIIRALIPYKDDYLIFGCASSIWVLTGDPLFSGTLNEIDHTVGMYGAQSWCFDGDGNLYFWGSNGIYKIPLGFRSVEPISEKVLPNLVADEDIDPTTHRITMEYDRKRQGIIIAITKLSDGSNSNYFYSLITEGFFPESYPNVCGVYSMFYYAANDNDYADLLLGCKDGYIRKYDDSAKDDDSGASDTAISSYFTLEMLLMGEQDNREGKLTSITIELGGGASGGTFSDTDGVSYDIHTANDAETCLEDILDGATPHTTGTLSGTGRKHIRGRIRGRWLGIKFYNSTASESFAINLVSGEIKPAGRI